MERLVKDMERLRNKFWTNEDEMVEEIEELGYEVIDMDYEHILVMDIDDRMAEFPKEISLKLLRANKTITILI